MAQTVPPGFVPDAPPPAPAAAMPQGFTPDSDLPTFRETNAKDANGNAIVNAASTQLQRDDLPESVRKELEDIRDGKTGTGDNFLAALTPHGAHAILSGLLAPVRAWGEAGPHRVATGIREALGGQFSKGANDVLIGGGMTALPMVVGPAVQSAIAAPGATALTLGAGAAATATAPPVARALGASDDQADLTGTLAGIGAGGAVAKYGVPALSRWSANNRALTMGKSYVQSTRDIQAALGPNVSAEDIHRARPFLEAVHNNGIPIVGKEANGGATDQLVKAADVAVDEIEQHVSGLVQQFPRATVPPSVGPIMSRIGRMPGASAEDLAAARQVIAKYGLDQPRSLADAESLRVRLNAENRSILEGTGVRQRTAVLTNPDYVARQEAANQLRDGIYGSLEQNGVQGIRDLRLSEGAILKIRNAADPITRGLRSESTVARTGETSLPRRLAQHVVRAGSAAAGAYVGGPVGAGLGAEIGQDLGAGLTSKNLNKNALLERAFQQSFTSPPVMSVQGIRAATAPMPSHVQVPAAASPRLLSPPNAITR